MTNNGDPDLDFDAAFDFLKGLQPYGIWHIVTMPPDGKHATMRELLTRGVRREKAPIKPLPSRWVLGRVAEGITHIPADWDLVMLTKVAKLESGHTPSRDKPDYWNGETPWLSLADTEALDALEVDQTSECVTTKGIANSSARVLPKDTVVFSRTANRGDIGWVRWSACPRTVRPG